MKYQITCFNTKISEEHQKEIIERISKVEKLLHGSENFDCRIVVKFVNDLSKVEVTIPTPYLLLRCEVEAKELEEAIDLAKEKLEKQIGKVKSRLDRSSEKVNLGKIFGIEEVEEEPIYIKNKTIKPKTMTLDDAIMEMESSDHDFYIYEDIEDHTLSIVYKRKVGGYGVIDIE